MAVCLSISDIGKERDEWNMPFSPAWGLPRSLLEIWCLEVAMRLSRKGCWQYEAVSFCPRICTYFELGSRLCSFRFLIWWIRRCPCLILVIVLCPHFCMHVFLQLQPHLWGAIAKAPGLEADELNMPYVWIECACHIFPLTSKIFAHLN